MNNDVQYTMIHALCVVTEATGQNAVKRADDRDNNPANSANNPANSEVSHEHATDTKAKLIQEKTTNAETNPASTL